jgi:hypothetical protein
MALLDRWEYRVAELDLGSWSSGDHYGQVLEAGLNALGEDGWELVSAVRRRARDSYDERLTCIFKRPREA